MKNKNGFLGGDWFFDVKEQTIYNDKNIKIDVCFLTPADFDEDLNDQFSGKTTQSNAYLMSASPNMYNSLKSMVDMMDSGDEHGKGSEWHKEAVKALAKAEGLT